MPDAEAPLNGEEIVEGYIWLRYCLGRDAASTAAEVNKKFGHGEEIVTPESVAAWTTRFSALRDERPQTPDRMLVRLAAAHGVLRGQLALAEVRFRDDPPAKQRIGARMALQAACDFVEAFVDAPDGQLTAPLRALMTALVDLDRSDVHPMLIPAQAPNRPPLSYRQSQLIRKAVAAMAAAMAEGNKREEAGRMVADELHKRGYRLTKEGKPIDGDTVVNWRAEAKRGPGGSYDLAAKYLAKHWPHTQKEGPKPPKGSWKRELAFLDEFGQDLGLRKKPRS